MWLDPFFFNSGEGGGGGGGGKETITVENHVIKLAGADKNVRIFQVSSEWSRAHSVKLCCFVKYLAGHDPVNIIAN